LTARLVSLAGALRKPLTRRCHKRCHSGVNSKSRIVFDNAKAVPVVLWVQNTTYLNWTHLCNVEGLGLLGAHYQFGIVPLVNV